MVKFYCSFIFLLFCVYEGLSLNGSDENVQVFSRSPSNSPISKVFIFGKPYYIRDMKAKFRNDPNEFTSKSTIMESRKGFSSREEPLRDYVTRNNMGNYYYQPPSQEYYPSPPAAVISQHEVVSTYATTPRTTTTTTTTTTTELPRKNDYPLESCYTNKSGFMCCNKELEDLMISTFKDLLNSKDGKWNKCNIQEVANRVQRNTQTRFGLNFESIAGIGDFASKSNFYADKICKIEIMGRFLLAYATPVQPSIHTETVEQVPYHKIRM